MAKLLKLRRGTTSQHSSFTGAEGEVTIDTTKDTAVVHDGTTQAGRPLAREDMTNVSSASIVGRIGTSALAGTKVSPDFGSQDVSIASDSNKFLAGASEEMQVFHDGTSSVIKDTRNSGKVRIQADNFDLIDKDSSTTIMEASASAITSFKNHNFSAGVDVTGNIIASGDITANGGDLTLSSTGPAITFVETNDNPDYKIQANGGVLTFVDTTNSATRFIIGSSTTSINTNLDVSSGVDVTGNITVTGTVDGRDVASDGSKLDGIESGATADQTASEILTLIKTVDGGGSGLDADFLDGVSSGSFLRTDTADTASGDVTFSGGAGAVTVSGGSDIRLTGGTWTGEFTNGIKIQPDGTNSYFQYEGTLFFRDINGSNKVNFDSSGNLTAAGNVTAFSDARLKTEIHTINDALGICGKLRGVNYKWLADGKPSIGVIAQEVEEVVPEVVVTNQDVNPVTQEITEVKSVDYGKLVGVLINAVNELKAELDAHKAECAKLHGGE